MLFISAAVSTTFASAAVVHKIDDTAVTGDVQSIIDGKLTLKATSAVVISLDDISQITFKDPPAPPAPKPVAVVTDQPQQDDNSSNGSLLGALFGSSHPHPQADQPPAPTSAPVVATTAPTSQPTNIPALFKLTDDDQIHANLTGWADQKIALKLSNDTTMELSSNAISELWAGTQELQGKAKKLTVDPGPEDIAFVTKDEDVVVVKGFVLGIAGDSLQFRYDNEDKKIKLAKIVGLLLRSNSPAPIVAFHQVIHTDNGDQFSGTLSGVDHGSIVLNSPVGSATKIPSSSITSIDFLNGRLTYLTDLKPTRVEQTPYFGRLMSYQINKSLTGGPLVFSDGTVTRGIAVHSRCVLEYDVSSGFDRFKTKLGFQQPEGQLGRVSARVLGDGKVLYENSDARGDQPPIEIDVPTLGVKSLVLEIDFGKDQDTGDRVVWGNPRLLRGK